MRVVGAVWGSFYCYFQTKTQARIRKALERQLTGSCVLICHVERNMPFVHAENLCKCVVICHT